MLAIYLSALAATTAGGDIQEPAAIEVAPVIPSAMRPPVAKRPEGPNLPPTPRYGLDSRPMYVDRPKDGEATKTDGSTDVELTVSRWGRVADCRVVASSGSQELDERACAAFATRAQFWPATDANGKDTTGVWRQKMDWAAAPLAPPIRIAPAPPPTARYSLGRTEGFPRPPSSRKYGWARLTDADWPEGARDAKREGTSVVELAIDRAGKVAECRVATSSGHVDLDAQACKISTEKGDFRPATGLDGQPAPGLVRQSFVWREPTAAARPPQRASAPVKRPPVPLPSFFSQSGSVKLAMDIDKDGKVERCTVDGNMRDKIASVVLDRMCKEARERGFRAGLPRQNPLPRSVEVEMTVKARH